MNIVIHYSDVDENDCEASRSQNLLSVEDNASQAMVCCIGGFVGKISKLHAINVFVTVTHLLRHTLFISSHFGNELLYGQLLTKGLPYNSCSFEKGISIIHMVNPIMD